MRQISIKLRIVFLISIVVLEQMFELREHCKFGYGLILLAWLRMDSLVSSDQKYQNLTFFGILHEIGLIGWKHTAYIQHVPYKIYVARDVHIPYDCTSAQYKIKNSHTN